MSDCRDDVACAWAPSPCQTGRQACLRLLATLIDHAGGDARGLAVFLLDHGDAPSDVRPPARPSLDQATVIEVSRRLRAVAPAWNRLLRGDHGEFVVIAQGLVDGGTVLGTAARLVHAFDEALQGAETCVDAEVSVGIAFAPQHDARAEVLLAAAEASLREASIRARRGRRKRRPAAPPSDSAA